MKRCPRCEKTYPDSETFCEDDGTALVPTGPAFAESAGGDQGQQIECPVCGGKAQPGELICNFCGARLGVDSAAEQYTPPPSRPAAPPRNPDRQARSLAVEAYDRPDAGRRRRRKRRPRDVRRPRLPDCGYRCARRRRLARDSSQPRARRRRWRMLLRLLLRRWQLSRRPGRRWRWRMRCRCR